MLSSPHLNGYRENPFGNQEPCNPKSIKPTDYKQSNIINSGMKDANNKRKSLNSVEGNSGSRINRS
tara:strand:- start:187 stop:384 length:198 start_codon:yes stop_codon:yes gene_type:complete